ncbi:MAG: hypothetical protein AAGC68_15180, partial [Verrucomicrobiota bacterium]
MISHRYAYFATLWFICFQCVLLLPGEEENTGIEELDTLLNQYRSQVRSRIDEAHETNVEKLKQNYIAALERSRQSSQRAGNLEETVAFQREINSITNEGEFSTVAETETVLRLRGVFETGLERLQRDRSAKLAPFNKTLLGELDKLILAFTRAGRIDEAVVARGKKEEVMDSMAAAVVVPKIPVRTTGELRIKVDIPHYSELKVRGAEVWHDHTNGQGALPGLREDPLPTYVEGDSWMPKWEGKTTARYPLEFSLPLEEFTAAIDKRRGRGTITLVEQPTEENSSRGSENSKGYRAVVFPSHFGIQESPS